MRDKIILVTGSAPPDACGVGDYTWTLAAALEKAGANVELFCHREWNWLGSYRAIRSLIKEKRSIVHIQYPTMGYGASLGPQLYACLLPSVVTLHEFSLAHPVRKIALIPFTLRSKRIVLTSEFEYLLLARRMPWARRRMKVIPIGSNIPVTLLNRVQSKQRILYHGLVMPRKGLEDFIKLAAMARTLALEWDFVVIGKIPNKHSAYGKALIESSATYGLTWVLDQPVEQVSALLSEGGIAYLPFPDGASERRGSLKAVLAAGIPCITKRSEQTPGNISGAVAFASDPQEAMALASHLMSSNTEWTRLSQGALDYASNFTWERIAKSHLKMYEELCTSRLSLTTAE